MLGPQLNAAAAAANRNIAKVALAGGTDTGGGIFAWQVPTSSDVVIDEVVIDVTTQSTGACTIDVGSTATSATTSSDNLIDGLSVVATGTFNNNEDKGTNGKSKQRLATGKWVTGSRASGASAGLAGYAYIHYFTI